MDVYLKNEKEKDTFHFPVNPFSITLNRSKRYETADIINVGEIDFTDSSKKIKELSFNTLFPIEYSSFCKYQPLPKPIEVLKKLEKWMEQKEPIRLIVTNFDFNDLVIISSISEDEKGEETGDKYVSINFRIFREVRIEKMPFTEPNKTAPLTNNRPKPPNQKTYTVVPGDSLWKIAVQFYGNGVKWPTIYDKNRSIIGSNPNLIYPNQRFVIP